MNLINKYLPHMAILIAMVIGALWFHSAGQKSAESAYLKAQLVAKQAELANAQKEAEKYKQSAGAAIQAEHEHALHDNINKETINAVEKEIDKYEHELNTCEQSKHWLRIYISSYNHLPNQSSHASSTNSTESGITTANALRLITYNQGVAGQWYNYAKTCHDWIVSNCKIYGCN